MIGSFARGTITTAAILTLRTATLAASLLLLARLLGAESYGRIAAASALAVVLGILPNLGAGYVMLAQAPRRDDAVADVWRYAWPLTLVIGLALLALYLAFAQAIAGDLALPLHILFWIGGTELVLTPLISLLGFALQAKKRVPLSQIVQWIPFFLRILAILPCFYLPEQERLSMYAVLQFFAVAFGLLISLGITARHVELRLPPRRARRQELMSGANYSLMHVVAVNSAELDKILAIRWLSAHDTGVYAATIRVINALITPVIALLLNSQPRIFQHAQQPGPDGIRLIKLVGICAAIWGVLSCLILNAISPALPLLFGSNFNAMRELMPLAATITLPLCLRHAAGTILVALGKPGERILLELTGIAALISCMAAFIPSHGIPGLIAALVISETTMSLIGWFRIYQKIH